MPYIPQDRRTDAEFFPETAGELNFAITQLIQEYQKTNLLSYQTINDILGALEGAKQEYYRRVAVPYENGKLAINGDVY